MCLCVQRKTALLSHDSHVPTVLSCVSCVCFSWRRSWKSTFALTGIGACFTIENNNNKMQARTFDRYCAMAKRRLISTVFFVRSLSLARWHLFVYFFAFVAIRDDLTCQPNTRSHSRYPNNWMNLYRFHFAIIRNRYCSCVWLYEVRVRVRCVCV